MIGHKQQVYSLGKAVLQIAAILVLSSFTFAQQSGQASPSLDIVREFFKVSGWHQAPSIRTVVALGMLDNGDGNLHAITIKVDRQAGFRSEIPDIGVLAVATPSGGTTQTKGKNLDIPVSQATQLSSSALVPIFTPLVEVNEGNVLTGLSRVDTSTTTISLAKVWRNNDKRDDLRSKSGLLQATFSNSTHLLASVSYKIAFPFELPHVPVTRMEYSDYRVVDNVLLPFVVKEYVDDNLVSTITFSSFALNAPVNSADFAAPEAK